MEPAVGAWGEGIEEDDTVLDVIETFVEQLRATQDAVAATAKVRQEFMHAFAAGGDPDVIAKVRLGLALSQWRYGSLEPALLDEVRADLEARRAIDSYRDAARREQVVRAFAAKLAKPNPKPRAFPKPPKTPQRPTKPKLAAFEAGDCLALRLPSGAYRAALVLARDRSSDTEEFNVVARLDWQGPHAPPADIFTSSQPLHIAMYPPAPYKGAAHASVVDRIQVDPARFGIEKMPDYWSWQIVRPGRPPRPMTWVGWEELTGAQP